MVGPIEEQEPDDQDGDPYPEFDATFIANDTSFKLTTPEADIEAADKSACKLAEEVLDYLAFVPDLATPLALDEAHVGLIHRVAKAIKDDGLSSKEVFGSKFADGSYLIPVFRLKNDPLEPEVKHTRMHCEYDMTLGRLNNILIYGTGGDHWGVLLYLVKDDEPLEDEFRRVLHSRADMHEESIDTAKTHVAVTHIQREGVYYKKTSTVYENLMTVTVDDVLYRVYGTNLSNSYESLMGLN